MKEQKEIFDEHTSHQDKIIDGLKEEIKILEKKLKERDLMI